jgi:hypothetical protein
MSEQDTGIIDVDDIERRLAFVMRSIDVALALRDRARFHRACALRRDLLTLRAKAVNESGRGSMLDRTRQEPR